MKNIAFLVGLQNRIFILYFTKVPVLGTFFCMFSEKSCSPLRKVAYKCRTTDPQLRNPLLSGLRGSRRPIAETNVNPALPFPVGLLLARNHFLEIPNCRTHRTIRNGDRHPPHFPLLHVRQHSATERQAATAPTLLPTAVYPAIHRNDELFQLPSDHPAIRSPAHTCIAAKPLQVCVPLPTDTVTSAPVPTRSATPFPMKENGISE